MSGVLLLIGGLVVTLYSWKRYRLLLEIAERLGEQAVHAPAATGVRQVQGGVLRPRALAGRG
jgi:hypothetical protein